MKGQNNLFRGSSPSWANACVGNNGSPSFVEYAKGFSAAANLLIQKTLEGRDLDYSVDEFIYPICFNMRHSVELRLKGTVSWLQLLSKHRQRLPDFSLQSSHDLGRIWAFIKSHAPTLDKRYQYFVDKLDDFVSDLSEVDPTGQTFRYPHNQESEKHLTEVSVINVFILQKAFSEAEELLDKLNAFNEKLCLEYEQGTYTRKMSRHQIYLLAKELPPRSSWGDESFKFVKDRAKDHFGLSSNDFSRAARKIESHFELAVLIDKNPLLEDLDFNQVDAFFDAWASVHDLSKLRAPTNEPQIHDLNFENVIKELYEGDEKISKALDSISSSVTAEAVGELRALFYFARDLDYSEHYLEMASREKRELGSLRDAEPGRYNELLCKLIYKTNAFQNIVKSLLFLNQIALVNHLIDRYELPKTLEWLDRAKSRKPCSHLTVLGYDSWADVDSWLTQTA
ncbi:hypothetical protein KUV59_07795 [Marinobacter daepoensis]|uniref:hypothetical protein n=1 Tax=Marinobacter daepoensis TaxID=262077 RepID=UPI001C94B248|nr:hypothetical protein [Marinobacter daepoensis]MBY6033065.1 hypothetical protein [Marinobacter daepoensis]